VSGPAAPGPRLLPCPFCGGRAEVLHKQVGCTNPQCYVDGPQRETNEEAIAAWNRRAAPPRERIEDTIVAVESTSSGDVVGPANWLAQHQHFTMEAQVRGVMREWLRDGQLLSLLRAALGTDPA